MAIYSQGNLGTLLQEALGKLKQLERLDEYLKYLNEEWYYTVEDLRLAREDEKIWFSLKLPGRLKLELSVLLYGPYALSNIADSKDGNQFDACQEKVATVESGDDDAVLNSWVKCWAPEHECYYFYNTMTEESTWEDPRAGDGTVYDVYQYSEEEQRWVVVEEASPEPAERHQLASSEASSKDRSASRSDSKYGDSKGQYDHKLSAGEGGAAVGDVGFTKPRMAPRAATGEDVLFVASPNRPKFAKSLTAPSPDRAGHKAHYQYSTAGSPLSGLRKTAGPTGAGESPVVSPGGRRARSKPVRIGKSALSSDESASSNDSDIGNSRGTGAGSNSRSSPVRTLRRPVTDSDPTAAAVPSSALDTDGPKRHSPLNSRPGGRPVANGTTAPKRLSPLPARLVASDEKDSALSALRFRHHPSHMHDWDSKAEDSAIDTRAAVTGTATPDTVPEDNTPPREEEPYDFYRDYSNTEAEYVATESAYGGAYADGLHHQYPSEEYGGAGAEVGAAAEYDAYYGYYGDGYAAGDYITGDSGNVAAAEGYDYTSGDYGEHYDQQYYEGQVEEEGQHWGQHSATEEDSYGQEDPSAYNTDDSALRDGARAYDARWDSSRHQSQGQHRESRNRVDGIAAGRDPARLKELVYEESCYHHVAEPTAPPALLAQPARPAQSLPRFSPRGPGAVHYDRFRDDKSESPLLRGTPMSIPSAQISPVAVAVSRSVDGAEVEEGDDFYLVEATAADADFVTPRGAGQGDLMALAMGSPPGRSADPSPAQAQAQAGRKSKKGKITKLFRLNIFGKGPALPSTPPPPRDNRRDGDHGSTANPHSSAYRQAKQQERRARNSKNPSRGDSDMEESTHTSPRALSSAHNSARGQFGAGGEASRRSDRPERAVGDGANGAIATATASAGAGGPSVRRKPQPAAPDSAEAVAAAERYYAAQQQQQHQQSSHNSSGRGPPFASKERELHYRNLQRLMDMGFDESESILALDMCADSLPDATQMLLEGRHR